MAASIGHLQLTPVKGMATVSVQRVEVARGGLAGDRAFSVHHEDGTVLTARGDGALLAVRPRFDAPAGELELALPGGEVVRGPVVLGAPRQGHYLGKAFAGRVVEGPFAGAVSELLGKPVALVRHDDGQEGWDEAPVTLVARASLDELGCAAGVDGVDRRRFRMGLEADGIGPRAEDGWVGREVAVGGAALRVVGLTERCVITTRHPERGDVDFPALRHLARLRGKHEVCMGVLCEVARPGAVAVGDRVDPGVSAA